ncbi:MAG: hypothetical protein K6E54_05070 [Bacteroidaceae bacterium]|jgi:hypothetical protein|nr:hypothetical protein [Bacteroidaceae bacterium]
MNKKIYTVPGVYVSASLLRHTLLANSTGVKEIKTIVNPSRGSNTGDTETIPVSGGEVGPEGFDAPIRF